VLGSIFLDGALFVQVAGFLQTGDFALEKHRRIFSRMADLAERGEKIDRITVYEELKKRGEVEACDGLTYLVSLDDGLPAISNLDAYVRIVRDKALLRRCIFTGQKIVDRCLIAEDSPAEVIGDAAEAFLQMGVAAEGERQLHTFGDAVAEAGGLGEFLNPAKQEQGLPTGLHKLDELIGGLRAGEVIVIAARPGSGKTSLATGIVLHLGLHHTPPIPSAVFSLEMTEESLFKRMVCSEARVGGSDFRGGFLNAAERGRMREAADRLLAAPIGVDDTPCPTLAAIHARCRKQQAQHGLGLVVVDYLQLMESSGRGRRPENRTQEVTALSRGFKMLARDLKVPVILVSQLSRAPEQRTGDHRPQLADLRESGAIEQDADAVLFVFREEMYHKDRPDLRGQAELILSKNRSGPPGVVKATFLHFCTKFENALGDVPEPEQPGLMAEVDG
jgi:replicative DNA helicase